MGRGQLLVALALGLVLLALVVLSARGPQQGERAGSARDGEVPVWSLRARDVRSVMVAGEHGAWRVQHDPADPSGALWQVLIDGRTFPGDLSRCSDLIDALVEASHGVDAEGVPDAQAGLDQPVQVEVVADMIHRVSVGRDAPVGRRTWLRTPEGRTVAVHGGIGQAVRLPAHAYVDLRLLPGEPERVDIAGPGRLLAWSEAGVWRGEGLPADVDIAGWVEGWTGVALVDLRGPPEVVRWTARFTVGGVVREVTFGEADGELRADLGDGRAGQVSDDARTLLGQP